MASQIDLVNQKSEENDKSTDNTDWTIREEDIESSVFSIELCGKEETIVHVVVGKSPEDEKMAMSLLIWAINNYIDNPSKSRISVVHLFAPIKFIPTPLGKLHASYVNPRQKDKYIAQERSKRRECLHKFNSLCSASKVKMEIIELECSDDTEAKAILNLIHDQHIRKLVIGVNVPTRRSFYRKCMCIEVRTMADEVVERAPEFCEVKKIIYDGKRMSEHVRKSKSSFSRLLLL